MTDPVRRQDGAAPERGEVADGVIEVSRARLLDETRPPRVWWEPAPDTPPYRLWWSDTEGLLFDRFKHTASERIGRLQNWQLKLVDELPADAVELVPVAAPETRTGSSEEAIERGAQAAYEESPFRLAGGIAWEHKTEPAKERYRIIARAVAAALRAEA